MRFGKFGIVGIMGAVVQMVVFGLLVRWIPAWVAAAVAVEVAVIHNFCWHERMTWRDRAGVGVVRRLWRFHAANGAVSVAGNAALVWALTGLGVPALGAQAAAIAVCAPANFVVADRWVYGRVAE